MRTRRILGSLAAVVVAALILTGCSLLPGVLSVAAPKASSGAEPRVGQCWNATNAQAGAWADWRGSGASACSASHALYTYAVGRVKGVTARSWASGNSGALSTTVQDKAAAACDTTALIPKLRWNQQLIQGFFFVPTEAEWKAGARWVRCDVGLLAVGASLQNERLAPLPSRISTLVASVAADPERYEFCIDSPVPVTEAGPLDDGSARIADCRANPQWALTGHGALPEPAGAAYPSSSVANAESNALCSAYAKTANEIWIGYLPSRSEWASGEREVECWIGQRSSDTSGGVA